MTNTMMQPESQLATWQIDPAHTQAEFEVNHMMFSRVRGRFRDVEGTVGIEPAEDLSTWKVEAIIDAASVDTGQQQRDEHLRSPDFLAVQRFPQLRFRSRNVERGRDGKLTVTGPLTIRDVTRDVELEVTELGRGVDPWGKQRVGFSATTTIDRRDFGLTWNQMLEAGGVLVGNEVRITLQVQAVLQGD